MLHVHQIQVCIQHLKVILLKVHIWVEYHTIRGLPGKDDVPRDDNDVPVLTPVCEKVF